MYCVSHRRLVNFSTITFYIPNQTPAFPHLLTHFYHFASLHPTSPSPSPNPHLHLDLPSLSTITRFAPHSLDSPGFQPIAGLIIILLCKKNYTRNPYLTAKFVEVRGHTQHSFLPLTPRLSFLTHHRTSQPSLFRAHHSPFTFHLSSHPSYILTPNCDLPHASSLPLLCVQVLFVMTPGIQRRTHSLFDQFQYHPLAEHLSSVLMRIYIGERLRVFMMYPH